MAGTNARPFQAEYGGETRCLHPTNYARSLCSTMDHDVSSNLARCFWFTSSFSPSFSPSCLPLALLVDQYTHLHHVLPCRGMLGTPTTVSLVFYKGWKPKKVYINHVNIAFFAIIKNRSYEHTLAMGTSPLDVKRRPRKKKRRRKKKTKK